MRNFIKSFIAFNIRRPKLMVAVLLVFTIISMGGVWKLEIETSLNYLMPKAEKVYKLGQRANLAFVDNETFMITSIEASPGNSLFSEKTFQAIQTMVEEIEEYKDFDLAKENARLETLLNISGVIRTRLEKKQERIKSELNQQKEPQDNTRDIEAELDKFLLENQDNTKDLEKIINKDKGSAELWNIEIPLKEREYDQPVRSRQGYDYTHYRGVTLSDLRTSLDNVARSQLDTILFVHNMKLDPKAEINRKDFRKIMESWEDIYLFKSIEIIQSFMNPVSGKDISGKNNKLELKEFISVNENGIRNLPSTKEEFDSYQNRIRLNPLHKHFLYSESNKAQIQALAMSVILKNQADYIPFSEYFLPLLSKYDKEPLSINSMGAIVLEKYMSDYMKVDILKFMPFVLIMIILTFYLNFRSFCGVLLPTLTVIIAGLWTMGIMGYIGIKISLAVSILPPLLIALGSSYSIHMFNQFLIDNFKLDLAGSRDKLAISMLHISGTVLLAAFTTVISFMTLVVNQVTSLQHFGVFASLGAFFAMLVSMILIPAGLILMKPQPYSHPVNLQPNPFVFKMVHGLSYLSINHTRKIAVLFVILVCTGIAGITRIRTETAPLESFKKNSPVRIADNRINELFSGTINLSLIIDSGSENGVLDPRFLNWVENTRLWLDNLENKEKYNILSNFTFSDILKRMHMAFHADNPEYFKVPQDKKTIRQYVELLSGEDRNSDGRPDQVEQFVDKEFRRLNLIIRTGSYKDRSISSENDRNIIRVVNEHLQKNPNPGNYDWFFVGTGINMLILSDYIVKGQLANIASSLAIMIFIVFSFFKKIKISVLSMIPLIGSMSIIYGFMGFFNIPLDTPRAILASIAIGDGIDNTIHFLKAVGHHMHLGKSLRESLEKTYNETGVAIIYTSLAIMLGFSVLTLSNFAPIVSLGLLVAGIWFVTTIGALLFLPAYILLFHPEIKDIEKND